MGYYRPTQWFFILVLLGACIGTAAGNGIDFIVYHFAAQVSSFPARVYAEASSCGGYYYYAPSFLVFLAPLKYFSFPVAKGIWIFIECLSYLTFFALLPKFFPLLAKNQKAWFWLFIFLINPFHTSFQSLNVQLIFLALVLVGELLRRTKKPSLEFLAGVLITYMSTVKLYPGFLVAFYWLVGGRNFIFGSLGGLVLAFLLPILVFGSGSGVELWEGFFTNLFAYSHHHTTENISFMLCLPTMVNRFGGYLGIAKSQSKIILLTLDFITVALFFGVVLWRRKLITHQYSFFSLAWSLAMATMVFLNPSSLIHYFVFYIPAFAVLLEQMLATKRPLFSSLLGVGLGIVTLLISFTTDLIMGRQFHTQLELWNLPTLGAFLLMGLTFFQLNLKKA